MRSKGWMDLRGMHVVVARASRFLKREADEDRPGSAGLIVNTVTEGVMFTETRVLKSRR